MGAASSVASRTDVEGWSAAEVADLVTTVGTNFHQYKKRIIANGIDGRVLLQLDDDDLLNDLDIQSKLHRKTLLVGVNLLAIACA